MFKWEKLGQVFNPFDVADRPDWMYEFAQSPNTIEFDDFIRVYFCCRPKPDENNQRETRCAFVDLDKDDLTKVLYIAKEPVMDLGPLGAFDQFGTYPVSMIREDNKIYAYYGGWSRGATVPFNISLGGAISTNSGVTFTKMGVGPVLSHSLDEPFVCGSPKIRKYGDTWFLLYMAGSKWIMSEGRPEVVYKLRMAVSENGIDWFKTNRNLIPDVMEENECQAGPDVFYMRGKYHMFFTYRKALNFRDNKDSAYRIGYAYSYDMLDWFRDDASVGITFSKTGWDSEMLHYPHLFECKDKIYMLYNGNEFGRKGFGVARLDEH